MSISLTLALMFFVAIDMFRLQVDQALEVNDLGLVHEEQEERRRSKFPCDKI